MIIHWIVIYPLESWLSNLWTTEIWFITILSLLLRAILAKNDVMDLCHRCQKPCKRSLVPMITEQDPGSHRECRQFSSIVHVAPQKPRALRLRIRKRKKKKTDWTEQPLVWGPHILQAAIILRPVRNTQNGWQKRNAVLCLWVCHTKEEGSKKQ